MDNQSFNRTFYILAEYLPSYVLPDVKEQINHNSISEHQASYAARAMKDPTIAIILSGILGMFGIDRFYIGDVGLGFIKLLTCGGLGIWWIIDIFIIIDRTKEKNYLIFLQLVGDTHYPPYTNQSMSNNVNFEEPQ